MAFDLPRSPASLRFTGELRALNQEEAEAELPKTTGVLGRARPNAPPPTAARSVPIPEPAPPPPTVVVAPAVVAPPPAAALATPTRLTTMRGRVASIGDEDVDTLCLDREGLDFALLPDANAKRLLQKVTSKAGSKLPVPHFRTKKAVAQGTQDPTVLVRAQKKRKGALSLPLSVWVFAAMIAAVVSFQLAPAARDSWARHTQPVPAAPAR